MSARIAAALCILLGAGCTESHAPSGIGRRCDLPGGGTSACPEGAYCGLASIDGTRTCRTLCDGGMSGSFRCPSGEACVTTHEPPPALNPGTCWLGGDVTEGGECLGTFPCARGLWCSEDWSGPPRGDGHNLATCEPVCNTSADCTRPGERCINRSHCGIPCDPANASTCPTGSICRIDYCMWEPRAANCEYGGDIDCPLGQFCSGQRDDGSYICMTPVEFAEMSCPPGVCIGTCSSRPCGS
jgi:hypothetical protein